MNRQTIARRLNAGQLLQATEKGRYRFIWKGIARNEDYGVFNDTDPLFWHVYHVALADLDFTQWRYIGYWHKVNPELEAIDWEVSPDTTRQKLNTLTGGILD